MNDLNSSSSSDEQIFVKNQLNKMVTFVPNERAFFNYETKSLNRTYNYLYNESKCRITLPEISRDSLIISSLLSIRRLIVRIGVFYETGSSIQLFFGSGLLLNDKLVLTCAHNFDAIEWEDKPIRHSKIVICCLDPANESLFSMFNPSDDLIEAKLFRRGLIQDNMSNYDESNVNTTDLAILLLDKHIQSLSSNEFFDPKLNSLLPKSNDIPMNSQLFLISYNGELTDNNELNPYKDEKGFENVSIDKLNFYHNVNHKSVSIGRLIQDSPSNDKHVMHSCSTLRGSSGGVVLYSTGKFAGIHIGVANSRKRKHNDVFFNKETFNKFLPVASTKFRQFIIESIIPNIDNDTADKWQFDSK
ncbi:unnamed protein product [Rotaria magnacalcarata]|uniref:Serine protease n=2 Tax=Rotaria magnacalcarata TaxID=392030 RepID=A0A815H7V8_9BILA|nr:unnamed protein product [Rotaria magnacalcarata]